jgi:hypothetical protein
MNFVDNLSLSCGLKSSKPTIERAFFPVVPEKYITFHSEDHQSKQWNHLQEFINLIRPYLQKKEISIIELGWNKEPLHNIDISLKNIDPRNTAYVLEKSILHVGVENFLTQLSSFYDTPCVSLYSNTSPDVFGPMWGDKEKYRSWCIEPSREHFKPSYLGHEDPKSINSIDAESVAAKCLDILNIPHELSAISIIHMGEAFHAPCLEAVPDFSPAPDFHPKSLINLRLDYHFDETLIPAFANNRNISIISDKPVNVSILKHVSPALNSIFLKIDETFDLDYIEAVKSLGKPLSLILKDGADASLTRSKFFDFNIDEELKKEKKDLDFCSKICDTTRYKSSKVIFSKGKKYSSRAAFLSGISAHENELIIDDPYFWAESQYMKLYNIDDKENSKD